VKLGSAPREGPARDGVQLRFDLEGTQVAPFVVGARIGRGGAPVFGAAPGQQTPSFEVKSNDQGLNIASDV
jgi:hypothetical protein